MAEYLYFQKKFLGVNIFQKYSLNKQRLNAYVAGPDLDIGT